MKTLAAVFSSPFGASPVYSLSENLADESYVRGILVGLRFRLGLGQHGLLMLLCGLSVVDVMEQ